MAASDACAFCRIVGGGEEHNTVFEDAVSVAFLDRRPLFPGHVLLTPRAHIETLVDLPAELVGPFFKNAQLIARAVEQATDADGYFIGINNRVSQSVPHLHIHIVPRRYRDGLKGFFWPRNPYRDEAHAREIRDRIREAIRQMTSGPGGGE